MPEVYRGRKSRGRKSGRKSPRKHSKGRKSPRKSPRHSRGRNRFRGVTYRSAFTREEKFNRIQEFFQNKNEKGLISRMKVLLRQPTIELKQLGVFIFQLMSYPNDEERNAMYPFIMEYIGDEQIDNDIREDILLSIIHTWGVSKEETVHILRQAILGKLRFNTRTSEEVAKMISFNIRDEDDTLLKELLSGLMPLQSETSNTIFETILRDMGIKTASFVLEYIKKQDMDAFVEDMQSMSM